jgi:hypothetical protein
MPRGRSPAGDHALSNAERQARHRARLRAHAPPVVAPLGPSPRLRTNPRRRSRPQRWREAVAELLALQRDYAAWLAALPASLQDSATAHALQTVADLDLDELAVVEPPRGYGRD